MYFKVFNLLFKVIDPNPELQMNMIANIVLICHFLSFGDSPYNIFNEVIKVGQVTVPSR